ncbi:hypothetical protein GcM3_009021 [Golovinomyces cichoracearum]|uniref:HAUS augmin-like complex subunit 6 N-terminal domain-containing protein n=1 Tax=Golovinomyces cichoracearum TaxID=62708 RepID=A0A420JAB9_9PEZI|nr:hypothetical protein GcM3_009021 [Golovinomyces cichoracearum]
MSNISSTNTRSRRVPFPNSSTSNVITPPSQKEPSNISLFLTNLRLLNLDLYEDWPKIDSLTFSKNNLQQNQKKRISCVEWALYQLFVLWNPEEACSKLQPFFPPLEPLQSLNLRSALFRCLDQIKKNGVLGQDVLLRKTMLDECKGERFEEILAIFSNVVLKKVLQSECSEKNEAIAQQLAQENLSYLGERNLILSLIIAHRVSLRQRLKVKEELRTNYHNFSTQLGEIELRLEKRHMNLKREMNESFNQCKATDKPCKELQDIAKLSYEDNLNWLQDILSGESATENESLLSVDFDGIWNHVEKGTIRSVETKIKTSPLEILNKRHQEQESRLALWQGFGKIVEKYQGTLSTKKSCTATKKYERIDLGFTQHQDLQLAKLKLTADDCSRSVSFSEYIQLVNNMKSELNGIGKTKTKIKYNPKKSQTPERQIPNNLRITETSPDLLSKADDDWISVSDSDFKQKSNETSKIAHPGKISKIPTFSREQRLKPDSTHQSKDSLKTESKKVVPVSKVEKELDKEFLSLDNRISKSSKKEKLNSSPEDHIQNNENSNESLENGFLIKPSNEIESESNLANKISNSVSCSSPFPKMSGQVLSLAERTRISMSHTSLLASSNLLQEDIGLDEPSSTSKNEKIRVISDLTSIKSETDILDDLSQRTRKSMAGYEAAQKKAQDDRRKSIKEAKKHQRKTSHLHKVDEAASPNLSTIDFIENDPDYESVFKSRPRIKTSPVLSPERKFHDSGEAQVD